MSTLFGLTEGEWWAALYGLLLPTLGFVSAYCLDLRLRSVPGLPDTEDFPPPKWILPTITFASVTACAFAFVAAAHLGNAVAKPHVEELTRRFWSKTTVFDDNQPLAIKHFKINILRYSPLDHTQIYLNNRLVFGDHWNCVADYQCRSGVQGGLPTIPANPGGTRFPIDRAFPIPMTLAGDGMVLDYSSDGKPLDFGPADLVAVGENRIDITLARSGLSEQGQVCKLYLDVIFVLENDEEKVLPIRLDGNGFIQLRKPSQAYCNRTRQREACETGESYKICDRESIYFTKE